MARDRLALAGQGVSLSDAESRAQSALERVYRDAGLTPPDLATASAAAATAVPVAERMLLLLVRARTLVKVDGLVFHVGCARGTKGRRATSEGGGARRRASTSRRSRQRYGVTRKYAIPLLEYLDRERVTRRVGESRIVL